jgi:shikimate dehydrogenase
LSPLKLSPGARRCVLFVDGRTELTGIIGYPIDYTLSPAIHNAAFRSLDINWIYVPLRVLPERVGAAAEGLSALGFRGFNVTIPYKVEIGRYLDGLKGITPT